MTEKLVREEFTTLLVVCIVMFLFSFSFYSINIALPFMQGEFGTSLAAVQWISIIGNVLMTSLSLSIGRLGDLGLRNKLYRIGVALYALGSALCAFAVTFPQLLLFRIFMTIGLAMALPLTGAIVVARFQPERRGRALGVVATAMALGRISGPVIGGLILSLWSWQGIFLAGALIGTCASVVVFIVLKGSDQRLDEPFDLWGGLALFVGYPALLIALSLGPSWGWWTSPVLSCFLLSIIAWVGFFLIELRTEKPLIRLALFRNPSMTIALLCMIICWAAYSPILIFAPIYLRNVLELSPATIGLILTLPLLFIVLLSPISGWFADKYDGRMMVTLGLGFILLGLYFYSRSGPLTSYPWVGMTLVLVGIGIGLFQPANQRIAFSGVSEREYGVISAMLFSFGPAAGSLGTVVAVAILEGRLGGREMFSDPMKFAEAQQFTFSCLVPLAALGVLLSFAGRWKRLTRFV